MFESPRPVLLPLTFEGVQVLLLFISCWDWQLSMPSAGGAVEATAFGRRIIELLKLSLIGLSL